MGLSHHDKNDIEEEFNKALLEFIGSCSVIVTGENNEFEHGSGVAVKQANQYYILTAAHVLKQEPDNEKIRFIGRPNAPFIEVHKDHLPDAVFKGSYGPIVYSTAVQIPIEDRIIGTGDEDIAALKIQNAENYLPHTIFHDISDQGETNISVGEIVTICGFPGELAQQVEHSVTREHGAAAFRQFEHREIKPILDAPVELNPEIYFITDYTFDDKTCNPKGFSGCGVWSIPKVKEDKFWAPQRSKLLGIQSAFYPDSKLLKVVRVERITNLL